MILPDLDVLADVTCLFLLHTHPLFFKKALFIYILAALGLVAMHGYLVAFRLSYSEACCSQFPGQELNLCPLQRKADS